MLDLISTESLTDSLSDMLQPLMYLFSALTIVSVLACIIFIAHAIRSWWVQTATLQMQKDIADIKEQLRNKPATAPRASVTPPAPKPQPTQPNQNNTDIA